MDNIIFLIGSGRSGTTWLQLMLGSHESIATGQESQLFNNYFAPMVSQWNNEINYPKTEKLRFHGISSYLKEDDFYTLLKEFSVGVFNKAYKEKKTATYFLEKSPNNSHHIETIHRCFPNAKFIHLIRDGRDVCASMMAAKKSWGRYWAYNTAESAALDWKTSLESALKAKELTDSYMEVRYEELLTNGEQKLLDIFNFLNIEISKEDASAIYQGHEFKKLKNNEYKKDTFINPGDSKASGTNERPEPKDFFRKGISGDWKSFFNDSQLKEIYWVSGDLLHYLGYIDKEKISITKPLSIQAREIKKKLRTFIGNIVKQIK